MKIPHSTLPTVAVLARVHTRGLAGAAACLAALQALVVGSAGAASLSQDPLSSQVSQPARPNVVFTVDDSGSMQVHFMPEGTLTLNGFTVSFPSASVDVNYYMTDGFPGDPTHEGGWTSAGTVSGLKTGTEPVYQMQFRSPDVNTIFYNPDVTYLPWVNTSGVRFAAATPTAARWEPTTRLSTATFDLTTKKTYATNAYYWMSATYTRSTSYGQVCNGACTVSFNPGLLYRLKAGANPTLSASYDRYDINGSSAEYAPTAKHANRTDCAAARCTQTEERQNFANWFTYYRNRLLLTKASVAEVLNSTGNTMRVGMASINTGIVPTNTPQQLIDGQYQNVMRKPVRDLTDTQRNDLLINLRSMSANGGTPLKRAVIEVGSNYFMRSNNGNPWRDDPSGGATAETQCRKSYNILMTDGYYNQDELVTFTAGNVDNTSGTKTYVPDPALKNAKPPVTDAYGYAPVRPYTDSASNTLADYVMAYYVNDLRTNLANRITPSANRANAPYWQHLTHFTVGLGVKGDLDSRTVPLDANGKSPKQLTLAQITAGTLSWPAAIDTDARKIDDLWHAAVDSGGEFFSARNAPELTAALVTALGSAAAVNRSEGGVSATSTALVAGVLKFVPSYQSSLWTGELKAYKGILNGSIYSFSSTPEWEASKKVPAYGSRNLVTFDGTSGYAFDNSMSPALRDLVTTGSNQAALISYLRGDKSQEGEVSPKFRRREGPLPDFVNSTPLFVKGLLDEGYASLSGSQGTSYAAFLSRKAARTGITYIGGNGGFVHGFAETDGKEVFGFAPKSVLSNMRVLAALDYGSATNFHRYFVDGPLLEADAYVPSRAGGAEAWRNLVIGTLGAGGQGIYGLDVTLPGTLGVDTVQWEFSSADAAIGNIFTAPEVGRVGGRWMAFFGNGAHSTGGKSVLMAVDLKDRTLKQFVLESTTGTNGLMGVRLIKNARLEVQAAYAGDLEGNLWRVDFQGSAAPANWKISFGGAPLFVAKDKSEVRQPITVKPTVTAHSSGGNMVLFGTGKLFDTEDSSSKTQQTFYGIWDKTLVGESAATTDASGWKNLSNQRSQLVQQTISTSTEKGADGDTYYSVSANAVDWATKRGWYMDVGATDGQRIVYPALMVRDFVLIQIMVPAGTPAVCDSSSGKGYNFLLPALTGAQSDKPVWDSNGDGKVDGSDVSGAGYEGLGDGTDVVQFAANNTECYVSGTSGGKKCDTHGELKIRDRIWRQIVNPPQPSP